MLLPLGEVARVCFQPSVEILVVGQHQVLAEDHADDQGHHGPKHHGVELTRKGFLDDGHDGGHRNGEVGQHQPDPAG